jgi:predicted Zn-dependent peptidase
MEEVKAFFFSHYAPNNAILAVTGHITFKEAVALTEKWFGPIPRREVKPRLLPQEPEQTEERRMTVERPVPVDALYMAFPMCDRLHPDYYAFDMLSDLLCNGRSSRLLQHLVLDRQVFSAIDAYILGSFDAGALVITGKPAQGVTLAEAEQAVWTELERLAHDPLADEELEKVKNRFESEQSFNNMHYLNVAINLAYYELLGQAEDINREVAKYRALTAAQVQDVARRTFVRQKANILYYMAKK